MGGRRAYLRLRQALRGQRCSVDYSPYVSNALNRVQCWGRRQVLSIPAVERMRRYGERGRVRAPRA